MLVYLDSVIVIYAIEGSPPFQARAQVHLAGLRAAGGRFAASDLTWLECLVHPIRSGDAGLRAQFEQFLTGPGVVRLQLPTTVFERATLIRAGYNFKLADALHLAAAVEAGCDRFLTNDQRLQRFPDLPVDVLP